MKIISKNEFKKVPWKNGKGSTLELAINSHGTLNEFDWRLSIAKVEEDGEFSNFSGYTRNLVLIDGEGIVLNHNENQIDHLTNVLDFSTFDGANRTTAKLLSGSITDFNLMTRTSKIKGVVNTYSGIHSVSLKSSQLCFIYGLSNDIKIERKANMKIDTLPLGDLMQVANNSGAVVSGENFIVVYINSL